MKNVDLALALAMWERQRESLCENEDAMSSFNQKSCFLIKNIDFSLEKCRFGAKKGLLHYVLRRDLVIFAKNDNFELEICVKERGGRAARCMGSVPVAEIIASEARRDRTRGHAGARPQRVQRPLSMPFPGRSIERVLRDLATPSKKQCFVFCRLASVQSRHKNDTIWWT